MAEIERIITGTDTGKSALEKTDRNVVKLNDEIEDIQQNYIWFGTVEEY